MRYTKSIISLIIILRDRKYNIPSVVIVVSKPSDPIQKKINLAQFLYKNFSKGNYLYFSEGY